MNLGYWERHVAQILAVPKQNGTIKTAQIFPLQFPVGATYRNPRAQLSLRKKSGFSSAKNGNNEQYDCERDQVAGASVIQ